MPLTITVSEKAANKAREFAKKDKLRRSSGCAWVSKAVVAPG